MTSAVDRTTAQGHDAQDELAGFRAAFHLPLRKDGSPAVYFCGHSLGLAPRSAAQILSEELAVWASMGVEGHFDSARPWLSYHELLAPGLARLAGAHESEVVAMNSLTANLHLMLTSFYRPTRDRARIVIEKSAFPSDRYAVSSQITQRGFDPARELIEIAPRAGEVTIRNEDICALIDREGGSIATIMLPGVQYLSGQCFDMAMITKCAQRQGATVGFDLAHAIGNVPLQLHDWNVDFAVWCSYKYLNSGPGAIGGCFVPERHGQEFSLPRCAGWWGHDKASRFDMPQAFQPLPGAEGWQVSNPSIFAAAPLLASLQLFDAAGMHRLRAKSIALTEFLAALLEKRLHDAVTILTPESQAARGSQLSLRLNRSASEARSVHRTLTGKGYVCDWREPDVIRIAPVPLYNTFTEVWEFVDALTTALQNRSS